MRATSNLLHFEVKYISFETSKPASKLDLDFASVHGSTTQLGSVLHLPPLVIANEWFIMLLELTVRRLKG